MAHDHDHDHNEDVEEDTLLDAIEDEIKREAFKIDKATALSAKEVAQHRIFPLLKGLVEAVRDSEERMEARIFGDDEEGGILDDLEDRVEAIEDRISSMIVGLEARVRLAALARSIELHCQDKPNVLAEAREALEFVSELDMQAKKFAEAIGSGLSPEAAVSAAVGTEPTVEPDPTPVVEPAPAPASETPAAPVVNPFATHPRV